jgi:hypothetical protein
MSHDIPAAQCQFQEALYTGIILAALNSFFAELIEFACEPGRDSAHTDA